MKVIFTLVTDSNGSIVYPMDAGWFRHCRVVGADVIGNYIGAADALVGAIEYTDEWSPAPVVYRKILTPREFMSSTYGLSGANIRAVETYYADTNNTYADAVYGLWWTATTASYIDLDDADMLLGLNLLVALTILTQTRLDEIMTGIPE